MSKMNPIYFAPINFADSEASAQVIRAQGKVVKVETLRSMILDSVAASLESTVVVVAIPTDLLQIIVSNLRQYFDQPILILSAIPEVDVDVSWFMYANMIIADDHSNAVDWLDFLPLISKPGSIVNKNTETELVEKPDTVSADDSQSTRKPEDNVVLKSSIVDNWHKHRNMDRAKKPDFEVDVSSDLDEMTIDGE